VKISHRAEFLFDEFTAGRDSSSILIIKSRSARYSLISKAQSSSISIVCSSIFNVSSVCINLSSTDSLSMLLKISVEKHLPFGKFFAEIDKSDDLNVLVRTSTVKRWLMPSTTLFIALVSSLFSYSFIRFLKWLSCL